MQLVNTLPGDCDTASWLVDGKIGMIRGIENAQKVPTLGTILTLNQPMQMAYPDFLPHIALLDRDMGFSIAVPAEAGEERMNCLGALASRMAVGDWVRIRVDPALPVPVLTDPEGSSNVIGEWYNVIRFTCDPKIILQQTYALSMVSTTETRPMLQQK